MRVRPEERAASPSSTHVCAASSQRDARASTSALVSSPNSAPFHATSAASDTGAQSKVTLPGAVTSAPFTSYQRATSSAPQWSKRGLSSQPVSHGWRDGNEARWMHPLAKEVLDAPNRPLDQLVRHGDPEASQLGDRVPVHGGLRDRRGVRLSPELAEMAGVALRSRCAGRSRCVRPDSGRRARARQGRGRASPSAAQITTWKHESQSHAEGIRDRVRDRVALGLPVRLHDRPDTIAEYRHRTMPRCAVVSFRLGLSDGVSIVASSWASALDDFGFDVVTVAGEGPVDRCVPGLSLTAAGTPPSDAEVSDALADADLVIVENLCTIPLNLPAARAVARTLGGRPAVLHHHDPAVAMPPSSPMSRSCRRPTRRGAMSRSTT